MKTVVVTGASRGLGKAIATELLNQDYRVVGISRSGNVPDGAVGLACDVGDASAVKEALTEVAKDKSLYALINAAGIASMNLAITTPPETVEKIIRTNLIGTINCCIALAKRLSRNKGGRIINFSTIAVPISLKGESVYVASKAGVEGFSRSFAREMADFGATVNVIAPGPIDTDLIAGVPSKAIDKIIANQIIPEKFGKDAVIELVEFLLSDRSRMLSGQVLNIGGA
ncbi:MAG: SDR family NAD(P)-dependent oxidoreductase [Pirellulaceae bacterium]